MKRKKYRELKESIRIMNSQKSDVEKINLIEVGKKIGINDRAVRAWGAGGAAGPPDFC